MERDANAAALVAAMLIAVGLAWALLGGPTRAEPFAAGPVPTLQPTPAIVVPTSAPLPAAPPAAVYVENNGGSVTIQQTNVDVDICISLDCD